MRQLLRTLTATGIASCMVFSVPALAGPDKPKGDHPERHCKPEKHQCGSEGSDDSSRSLWDVPDYGDNPSGDHTDGKCYPEREWCQAED